SAVRHLVELLSRDPDNLPLAAGEIVTSGILTRALPVKTGETWATKLKGIGLEGISLRFSEANATKALCDSVLDSASVIRRRLLRTCDPGPLRCAILDLGRRHVRGRPSIPIQNNSGLPQGPSLRSEPG